MQFAIVARHFPPAISGGARRPYLLAQALTNVGHTVVVIAPQPCAGLTILTVPHPVIDPAVGTPGQETWRDRLRRTVLLPDPDIRWALRAARTKLPVRPDWVITTSPPESAHVTGFLLKRRYKCRWAVDLRDHWFEHALRPQRRAQTARTNLERRLARALLRRADAATALTTSIANEISSLAPHLPQTVIGHFADPPPPGPGPELPPNAINVVHTGSFVLSDPDRRVEPVLAAFARAVQLNPRLMLHLVGRLRDDERAAVAASPARQRIQLFGPVSLDCARRWQTAADALLLVTAPDTPHIPGKLAEYEAAGRPIVVAGGGAWLAAAGIASERDLAAALARLPADTKQTTAPLTPEKACAAWLSHLERS